MSKKLGWMGVLVLLAACGNQTPQQAGTEQAQQRETAATVVPLLYVPGKTSPSAQRGAQLALDEVNTKNWRLQGQSVRFVLIAASGNQADLARAIRSHQAVGALGYFNAGQAGVLQQQGIPGINLSGQTTPADGQNVFHIKVTEAQQGSLIGQYLVQQQGLNNVAIISHGAQTELTQALQNQLQAAGARSGMYILGQTNQAGIRQLLRQLATARPAMVFYGGDEKSAALLVKKMQQNKVLVPVMLSEQAYGQDFVRDAGRYAIGSMAVVNGMALANMGGADDFGQRYARAYGREPTMQAAYAYDAAWALATAMKLADSTDPNIYASKLKSLNMSGGLLSGALTFDNRGWRNEATLTVYQVDEGGWRPADSIKANPNQSVQAAP